ncbi:unnamed protein product, partial [Durusdinium trenchii]
RPGRCSDLAARTRRMLAGSGPAVVPNGSAPSGADMASGPSERGERAPVAHDWMRGGRGHVSAADMASGPRMQQEADRPSVLGVAHGEHSWMTGGQVSAADMASGPGVQEVTVMDANPFAPAAERDPAQQIVHQPEVVREVNVSVSSDANPFASAPVNIKASDDANPFASAPETVNASDAANPFASAPVDASDAAIPFWCAPVNVQASDDANPFASAPEPTVNAENDAAKEPSGSAPVNVDDPNGANDTESPPVNVNASSDANPFAPAPVNIKASDDANPFASAPVTLSASDAANPFASEPADASGAAIPFWCAPEPVATDAANPLDSAPVAWMQLRFRIQVNVKAAASDANPFASAPVQLVASDDANPFASGPVDASDAAIPFWCTPVAWKAPANASDPQNGAGLFASVNAKASDDTRPFASAPEPNAADAANPLGSAPVNVKAAASDANPFASAPVQLVASDDANPFASAPVPLFLREPAHALWVLFSGNLECFRCRKSLCFRTGQCFRCRKPFLVCVSECIRSAEWRGALCVCERCERRRSRRPLW